MVSPWWGLAALLVLSTACTTHVDEIHPATSSGPVAPSAAPLPRSTPEAEGVSSQQLLAFLDAVDEQHRSEDSGVELHSLMILRNGNVVAEGWWAPYAPDFPHMLFSLSKSFTSTAVGIAVDEGLLALDDRVVSFFPEARPDTVSPHLSAMTIGDLLTMSTGQDEEGGPDPDWIRTFLAHPVVHEPGTTFRYNTMATFMLSAVLQRLTGERVSEYLRPRLFDPLGIEAAVWDTNAQGIDIGGAGLNIKTEDIARFGQLYLQEGRWNGEPLVPEAYVRDATSRHIDSHASTPRSDPSRDDWAQGYGYQFWQTTHGAYRGDGAFGQFAVIFPELQAVVVTTAGSRDMQAVLDLFWEHLLPAFQSGPLPDDEASRAALEERLASLTLSRGAPPVTSPLADQISGATYVLDDNEQGFSELSLTFESDSCRLRLTGGEGEQEIPCGIGYWVDGGATVERPAAGASIFGPRSTRIASTGQWKDDTTFVMDWQLVETPFGDRATATFDGDTVRLEFARTLGGQPTGQETRPTLFGRRTENGPAEGSR